MRVTGFSPESYGLRGSANGRSSDLLRGRAAFPCVRFGSTVADSGEIARPVVELTATGIVPELHRVPF